MGGYQLPIAMDILRGRYRESFEVAKPLKPDAPLPYRFELPPANQDALAHPLVGKELLRRPCASDTPGIQSVFSDDAQGNTRQSRSKPDAAKTMQILQTRP